MSGRPTPRYQVIRRSAHFLNIAGPAIVSAIVLTGLDKPPSGGTMTRTLRAGLVGAALGGLCLLGACGSDPSPRAGGAVIGTGAEVATAETDAGSAGSSGAAPGACGLVSPDALTTILQTAKPDEESITVETTERDLGGGSVCNVTWGGAQSTGREFHIDVFSAGTLPFVVETPQRSVIPGIGDEAYLGQEGNFYAQVGDWAVHVVNVQITDEVSTQILAAAARGLAGS